MRASQWIDIPRKVGATLLYALLAQIFHGLFKTYGFVGVLWLPRHKKARTTPAVRAEIATSAEPVVALRKPPCVRGRSVRGSMTTLIRPIAFKPP